MDAREWVASQTQQSQQSSTEMVMVLLKRRMMRFCRQDLSFNPLYYLHDHCTLGGMAGKDADGAETLYPRSCKSLDSSKRSTIHCILNCH